VHRIATAPGYGEISYEKLLEPNAMLLRELERALAAEGSAELEAALDRTASFLLDVLEREAGGFHLAQLPDRSSPDGGGFWQRGGAGPAPPVDALVLSGPNAMAAASLLRAGLVLEREEAGQAARRALDLVLEQAYRPGRGVLHSIEPAPAEGDLYLVTQAACAFGLADAYETTGAPRYLEAARDVARAALVNFRHAEEAALRDRLAAVDDVGLLREPRWPMRANVRLARALLRIGWHDADEAMRAEGERILGAFATDAARYDVHAAELGLGIEEAVSEPLRIHLPSNGDPRMAVWRRAAFAVPDAWKIVGYADGGESGATLIRRGQERRVEHPEALAAAAAELRAEVEP
jgi:uncharacterized protein YyaL (SSP411 family)